MPQNGIPNNPDVAAQAAAAGGGTPVQVHQGAAPGIPSHPGVIQQHLQAKPALDFFASVALGEDEVETAPEAAPPQAPAPTVPISPSNVDLVNIDDLLSGGQFPETPQPVQQPQQQQAPQAVQPQAAPQPQAQPQPQAPAPSQAPQQTPEDLQKAAIDYLRGNVYQFDDATARQALTEPEVVLPMLAARLHVNLVNEFATQVQRVVPVLVERETQRRMAVMEAKNEFFRMFPKLNRPEWEGVISESIGLAAQLNQGKSRHEIMREGAALAVYRIRSQGVRPNPAQGRPQPFVPANPGGGGMPVPNIPQQPGNPWAELAADPDLMNF